MTQRRALKLDRSHKYRLPKADYPADVEFRKRAQATMTNAWRAMVRPDASIDLSALMRRANALAKHEGCGLSNALRQAWHIARSMRNAMLAAQERAKFSAAEQQARTHELQATLLEARQPGLTTSTEQNEMGQQIAAHLRRAAALRFAEWRAS